MTEWVAALAVPVVGWAWNIERRLSKLENMKETVEGMDKNVWELVHHLIEVNDEGQSQDRRKVREGQFGTRENARGSTSA